MKDDFWGDLKLRTAQALNTLLESGMEAQVQDLVGAGYWERSRNRYGYRNGYYCGSPHTTVGEICGLRMPGVRGRHIKYSAIPKYKRGAKDVDQLVLRMFLAGVSAGRVKEAVDPILGKKKISAQTVSNISGKINVLVREYHGKELQDRYKYMIFDGAYIKAKSPRKSKKRCILVC